MYVMVAVVDVELTEPKSAHFDSEDDYRAGYQNVSNCQCSTTVLFRTMFTRTIILNLLPPTSL